MRETCATRISDTVATGSTGIAGSTRIGARCLIGGGVGFAGHIEICDDAVITGMAILAWLAGGIALVGVAFMAFGLFAHSGLDFVFHVSIAWWVLSLIAACIALTISLVGIRISTRIDLSLAIIADLVLLITSIAIVAKVASHGRAQGSISRTLCVGVWCRPALVGDQTPRWR